MGTGSRIPGPGLKRRVSITSDKGERLSSSSKISPTYSSGTYFTDTSRYSEDTAFKVRDFLGLFLPFASRHKLTVNSYIDVGCGSGEIVKVLHSSLKANGLMLREVKGYDVSPHVQALNDDVVEYVHEDFCASDTSADLVTLFDVLEHVLDPVQFLRVVSLKCKVLVCRIPLDDSLINALRDKFKQMSVEPGHLTFLDTISALNLFAAAGLHVADYRYCLEFLSPSGHRSIRSKMMLPFRYLLARVSPWLLSKTLGGVSLIVAAFTESGLRDMKPRGVG